MAAAAPETHLLTLKVMRLSKPGFAEQTPRLFEDNDLLNAHPRPVKAYALPAGTAGSNTTTTTRLRDVLEPIPPPLDEAHGYHPQPQAEAQFAITDMFRLPQNFGTIFLGETFSSYICVNNESDSTVRDVVVKAELQTTAQRFILSDSTEKPRGELRPSDLVDVVVSHEIKELNVHILVCSVFYTTNKDERKYFRKFFRFQVGNPLTVKTKVYNVHSNVFLEAQIQNITPRIMYMESVRFEPAPLFTLSDLNNLTLGRNERRKDVAGTFLAPQDLRQFLYKLTPVDTGRAEGKLDISWRTTMGEKGRLQTSQLPRKVPSLDSIEVSIASVPDTVLVERPFIVVLDVRNCTAQPMRLTIMVNKSKLDSLWPVGITAHQIGDVQPHQAATVRLPFLAIASGLLRLTGLLVSDAVSGRVNELDHIGDILVHRYPPSTIPA